MRLAKEINGFSLYGGCLQRFAVNEKWRGIMDADLSAYGLVCYGNYFNSFLVNLP